MRTASKLYLLAAILSGTTFVACAGRASTRDSRGSIVVDGVERTYHLHVPPSYDGTLPVPLVLALHGRLGTGEGQERLSHFDSVSDSHGFIVVYPDGLNRSWADGRGKTPSDEKGINDIKFLSELIRKLDGEYKIDRARVYATGMSNGGFMSGRLACDLSQQIAAVGIVAASLSSNTAAACHPAKPVAVLIMQGTADPLVPFQGGELGKNGDRGLVLSHVAAVEQFRVLDGCPVEGKRRQIPDSAGDGTSINIAEFMPCSGGAEVRSYAIEGGGHTWPGGVQYLPAAFIGKTSHNLDASETIWEFFARHSR
ncbi:MAG TPA: PHB depolymerase family esterase [Candidatus Eisenbacteria bacterium]|nr:PHB depolymerase family esterase [Candidatus Eisenbacteria bacterium]